MISHVTTLANGIIGVSVLAMPFCFKQCGVLLATLMLLLSSALSRLACHFLIKSAVMCRRRNFEFLAFHAFGPMGKFLAELCIIGFLLGTCVAYFVVVGDLGPQIVGELVNRDPVDIRTSLLITTGIFIVLPLGLLRNVSSLASVSTASVAFYVCLVFKVIGESTSHIFTTDWVDKIHYWRPAGMLQCLPIFALALFCQTQLFEIYEAMPNATLEKMNQVVRGALNICTIVYVFVGIFGYIGFCTLPFSGNILMSFEPSVTSEVIKIGFVLSVAFSFPLVIFPCRASLNSLLFRQGYTHLETSTSYISETRFRCLTTFIVIISMIVGILIPNIEFILGIVGSTIGVLICLIFPAAFFIFINTKNTNERLLAQILVIIGMWIMILGTYANLYAIEQSSNSRLVAVTPKHTSQIVNNIPEALVNAAVFAEQNQLKEPDHLLVAKDDVEKPQPKVPDKPSIDESVRREPPVPVERLPDVVKAKEKKEPVVESIVTISPKVQEIVNKIDMDKQLIDEAKKAFDTLKKTKETNGMDLKPADNSVPDKHVNGEPLKAEENPAPVKADEKINSPQKNDVIAVDAIKKEEIELAADKDILNVDPVQRREQLEKTLEKHIMQQEEMMQEQKELLKDIEQNKKELQLEKVEDQQKSENNVIGVSIVHNKVEKPIGENDQEKLLKADDKNIQNKEKDDLLPLKKDTEKLILESKEPQRNESIKIHEITHNESNKENKIDNLKSSDSIRKLSLDSNLNQGSPDVLKRPEDPIIKVLTKQSNKIENEVQAADIPKVDQKINVNAQDEKHIDKPDTKNKEYSIPFVLKVNSKNKNILNSVHLQGINQSNADVAAGHRNILEEHQREKRMADEKESNDFKMMDNKTIEENKNTTVVENIAVKHEKEACSKEEKKFQSTNEEKTVVSEKLIGDESSNDLIKTSVYLSGQDVIKTVSIDPGLVVRGDLVKVKSRDLKALEFDHASKH